MTSARRPPKAGPREFGVLVRAVVIFAIVLGLVGLLEFAGLVRVGDTSVNRLWFASVERFDLGRPPTTKIILIDDRSTKLPAQPWSPDVLLDLVTRVAAGHPSLIAAVGQQSMFEHDAGAKLLAELDALERRERGLSPGERARMQALANFRALITNHVLLLHEDGPSLWSSEALVDGDLQVAKATRFDSMVQRLALTLPDEGRLPVHWLLPASKLPSMQIDAVLASEVSKANFEDKVVLFGVTANEEVVSISTPAGLLSSAQIEAHALAGLSDNMVWGEVPVAWMWIGTALSGAFLLWFLHRASGRVGFLFGVLLVVAVLAIDYLAFSTGLLRLGVTRPLLLFGLVYAGYWALQAWDTIAGLGRLHAKVLYETGADRREGEVEDAAFWDDLAELGKVYAEQVVGGRTRNRRAA